MKGKLNIKILIIVIAVVLVAGGAGVFYVKSRTSSGISEEKKEDLSSKETFSVTLGDMYCNVNDSKKILKIKITVQTANKEKLPLIEAKQFIIRDEANKIIRNNSEKDLMGMEGMENLKRAIQKTLAAAFSDETIMITFDDFVIQ